MAINSLDGMLFVAWHKPGDRAAGPSILGETSRTVQRPGVDGTGIIQTGEKAMPFQMRSGVDIGSINDGTQQFATYKSKQNAAAYGIVWNDVDYAAQFGVFYVVLSVEMIKLQKIESATGGLGGGNAWLEALWTLQPIAV